MTLRTYFPDGNLSFYSVFTDLCNDFKFIFIFVLGFGIMAADDHGMKEVVRTSRWYNLYSAHLLRTAKTISSI